MFVDFFYFFMSIGCFDFFEFIDKLVVCFVNGIVMVSNYVMWLLV